MTEEKARQFLNDLQNVFDKYDVFIDPYIDDYDNVCIDILDKNENVIITSLEMDTDDFGLTGFFNVDEGLKSFITSYRSLGNE